ncbi:hypothetical protein EOI86_04125 [Hwanghaeella grinnelliae]|uniref:Parvulin-like PPIase n=1 Tax=Hwanghaeella grinnelliae TaxID=2500179 RepID=A0A3S3UQW9_9PROT|nr:peptidylprolyl isomerase [Hwanghaeella grinnelliae]RVU38478.1 hypothetical protein EOI86_04125 [Hwanghaeella grinnelliae]
MPNIRRVLTAIGLAMAISAIQVNAGAWAQQNTMRIAAIVNDDLISVFDLESRVRWVVLTTGIKPDNQNQRRIIQQVLRAMVDDRLRLQEAERLGIRVTDREIDQEITALANRNNMTADQFISRLEQRNVDLATVRTLIKASLAWTKVSRRQLRRQVDVTDEEVDETLDRLRESLNEPQKRLYEIFLTLNAPDDEGDTRQTAERIVQQAREGADFKSLAQAFSQSNSAENQGDVGWVAVSQLPPDLQEEVRNLSPGQVSEPIRTFSGFYILKVTEERQRSISVEDSKLDIYQIALPLPGNSSQDQQSVMLDLLEQIRPSISSCEDAEAVAPQIEGANGVAAKDVRLGDMSQNLQQALANLKPGETSPPVATQRAALLLTVCSRDDTGGALPTREQVINKIGSERMELLERRYMRDLRREAFIDIRL